MSFSLESLKKVYKNEWKNIDFSNQKLQKPFVDTIKQAFPNQEQKVLNIIITYLKEDGRENEAIILDAYMSKNLGLSHGKELQQKQIKAQLSQRELDKEKGLTFANITSYSQTR